MHPSNLSVFKFITLLDYTIYDQVKKLWRWRPVTAAAGAQENATEDLRNPNIALEAFMKGLNVRLGLGEDCPGVTVR